MKKSRRAVVWYVLLGIWIFSRIVFLFLDAKGYKIPWNDISSYFSFHKKIHTNSDIIWEPQLSEDDLEFLSWFLQDNTRLTTKDAEGLWNIKEKIVILEQLFAQQKNLDVIKMLIDAYMLNNQYDKAKKLYNSLPERIQSYLDPWILFKIGVNSFSQTNETEYSSLKRLLGQFHQDWIFSNEEYLYYQVAFELIDGEYETAQIDMQGLSWTKYQDFADAIQSAFAQYESLKDVPDYYKDGLVAYQLMNQWFLAWSKKIAIRIVNEHSDYILPYQILANVDFLTEKWNSASRYFHQLLELDPQEKSSYLYYLGICYYHLEDYSNAVLYLAQITDQDIMIDSDRYLVLSYIKLWENTRVFAGWQRLLWYKTIKPADYYSFFEEAFWKPYRKWKTSSYLEKNSKIVQDYLTSCPLNLKGDDAQICTYWQLGLFALENSLINADLQLQLSRFARKYAKPEFFQYLWEIQLLKWENSEASASFMRALWLTKETEEKNHLKQRILAANEIEQ